jgi:pyridinium-3,5-biscarboxylic acid mononucleotide sulfurtransferase
LKEDLVAKERRLREIISGYVEHGPESRVVVAFSGGVDSSLVLWEAFQALGVGRVSAVTATAPTSVPGEETSARRFARLLGVEHLVVPTSECDNPAFVANSEDRCYVCKQIRYQTLMEKYPDAVILDGTQADDDPTDRPGMRAVEELRVRTPLKDAGLGKEEVRQILREAGFEEIAQKIAQPCLATRIPTGTPLTPAALEIVGKGEALLHNCGLTTVRLRHHWPLARIVTNEEDMERALSDKTIRTAICEGLKSLGYRHVTLDLEPY